MGVAVPARALCFRRGTHYCCQLANGLGQLAARTSTASYDSNLQQQLTAGVAAPVSQPACTPL